MRRSFALAVTAGLGVLASVAIMPGTAQAATTKCAYEGYDRACVTNYATYSSWELCDNENDGHNVYTDGSTTTSWFYYRDSYGNGCARGTASVVRYFKIYESGGGSSSWVYM